MNLEKLAATKEMLKKLINSQIQTRIHIEIFHREKINK